MHRVRATIGAARRGVARVPRYVTKALHLNTIVALRCDFVKIESPPVDSTRWNPLFLGQNRSPGSRIDLEVRARERFAGARGESGTALGIRGSRRTLGWEGWEEKHTPRVLVLRRTRRATVHLSVRYPGGNMCRGSCVTRGTHIVRQEKCASGPTVEPVITTSQQHPANRGLRERNCTENIMFDRVLAVEKRSRRLKIKKIHLTILIVPFFFLNKFYGMILTLAIIS